MLPAAYGTQLMESMTFVKEPSKTYKLDFENNTIVGLTDELGAIRQAVALILATERAKFEIYSWDYGVEFQELLGSPLAAFAIAKAKQNIREALLQDDRISEVKDFVDTRDKDKVKLSFTVITDFGEIKQEAEVII